MVATRDFVGKGWRFPFRFDPRSGGVSRDQSSSDIQQLNRVRQSLFAIINTRKGELYFARRFGSRIRDLIFTLNTSNLGQQLQFRVLEAIEDPEVGENRVFINSVQTAPVRAADGGVADVRIDFVLRDVNVEGNFVFPFYLTDAQRQAAERGLKE